jgi:hypothetical protein
MEILDNLDSRGFSFIEPVHYLKQTKEKSLCSLNQLYATSLKDDGPRKRAYLKLEWDRVHEEVCVASNQAYFQSAKSNNADGGKPRYFEVMDSSILELSLMKQLIEQNREIIDQYKPLQTHKKLTLGLHFIQYIAEKGGASYSSPVGLHIDDEPLVFVHLISLSEQALGGDNLIARLDTQEITHVVRLEQPLDTILLNNDCYHAVTPLGSRHGTATRNILLFTVEPYYTQI